VLVEEAVHRKKEEMFRECMQSLSRDFPNMSYKEKLRECRRYLELGEWVKLSPKKTGEPEKKEEKREEAKKHRKRPKIEEEVEL